MEDVQTLSEALPPPPCSLMVGTSHASVFCCLLSAPVYRWPLLCLLFVSMSLVPVSSLRCMLLHPTITNDSEYVNGTAEYDYSSYYNGLDDFSPCSNANAKDFSRVLLPTLYSLVFILGFTGNGLVVCILVKHRKQINLTDLCLLNLALADLFFVFSLPLYSHYAAVGQWVFGDVMCHLASGFHNTGFFSSVFFMVAMTLDRYMVIIHNLKVSRYRTLKLGIGLTVLIWILSLFVSVPNFLFTKVTNESWCHDNSGSDTWEMYNLLATNLLGFVIPLLMMVICYSRIIPILMNMRSIKKHRIIKLIFTIVIVFFIFWIPYNIVLFLKFLQARKILSDSCSMRENIMMSAGMTEAIAYSHCCLNPIIYAFVSHKFMQRSVQLLKEWLPWIHFSSNTNYSESTYRKSSVMSRSSDVTSTFNV
ncbi:C-C chemokine receptor type 1-like [Thalassophryne amazonica]|uniref:C-C chemokine receptor type 1-like n=1 Tax=Thalassophryne amazonica TaxID=390379 RepID=UPI001471554B|nr:C-C chemokine receptor type 1-like [Thalassophryne amazonica]